MEQPNWTALSQQQVEQDLRAASETATHYTTAPAMVLQRLAGSHLAGMRNKVQRTQEFLQHENRLLRICAVFLLRDFWPRTGGTALSLAHVVFTDREAAVRGLALEGIYDVYGWLSDPDGVLAALLPGEPDFKHLMFQRGREFVEIIHKRRERWRNSIGSLAQDMLVDSQLVEQSLSNPDLQVREIALSIIAQEMQPSDNAASLAAGIIASQAEQSLFKKLAIHVLSRYRAFTKNAVYDSMIASLVKDESCSPEVRGTAYLRLLEFQGARIPSELRLRVAQNDFLADVDVDWSIVDHFS